ncbi:MAG TPA: glycine zipper 2TM domain-containing protein [Xanthomonadales bacterium]|nr:glycine zipper 2TM domain-containing protein [Xanthomonadales bacterium]
MKNFSKVLMTFCIALSATPAIAQRGGASVVWAKVVDAQPVYESYRYPVKQERCWEEEVWRREPAVRSATPVIVGSIIGGVIGNQFGGGSGNVALTAAGAVLGGSIANDASHRKHPDNYYPATEQRCAVETQWQTGEQIVAWDVRYRYHGEVYQARFKDQPGKRIKVRVDVEPLGY